jgi:hypothetical protein
LTSDSGWHTIIITSVTSERYKQVSEGLSIIDVADLPPAMRKIIRLVLNSPRITYQALREAVQRLPIEKAISITELDESLDSLCERGWLIQHRDGVEISYRVNLRRKRGHPLIKGIWSALGVETGDEDRTAFRRGGSRKLPDEIWNRLAPEGDATPPASPIPNKKRTTSVFAEHLWKTALADDGNSPSDTPPEKADPDAPED